MPLTRAMAAAKNNESVQGESNAHPPRKRAKTKSQVPKRGKRASLGRLLDMPPEVFNEIATHLLPIDLLSLARSNRFFRNIFMSRTSQHLWKQALQNIPDLPPCPPELSEPQYVSLIFSKTCSNCGTRVLRRMDPYLYVRLCNSCRTEQIIGISLFSPLIPFLPKSDVVMDHSRPEFISTLRSELLKIQAETRQDDESFDEWQKERATVMRERHERGVELEDYLDMMDNEREIELDDLRHQRQDQIKERLLEEGWTNQDMEPSLSNSSEWHKLVFQPKLITDRIWANLYPKLLPLLNSNRAYHDRIDKANRRRARITKIQLLTENIRLALPPLIHLTLRSVPPADQTAGSSTASTYPSSSHYPDKKINQPFPTMNEFLTWPMIRNIVEEDMSPEDAEAQFMEIRDEFDQAVVEWREKIEQDLIQIWNAGGKDDGEDKARSKSSTRKGKGRAVTQTRATGNRASRGRMRVADKSTAGPVPRSLDLALPEFVTTFTKPDGTTTTNISELSPSLQLLFRADTIFKSSAYVSNQTFPEVLPRATPFGLFSGCPEEFMYGERWDASAIRRDDETSALVKELLALVGRPGATSAEMNALGESFRCGRCNRTLPDSWKELVGHYAIEQSQWKQAQEKIKAEPRSGFIFNSTHDLEPRNPKPFAHFMSPQAAAEYTIESSAINMVMTTCMKCEGMGIQARYFHTFAPGADSPMKGHLRDVHNVTVARAGLEFRRWEHDLPFFDPFESDEEFFTEDDLL
ncbi:hypothetical protein OPQ81_002512 [Rhizoctonia solani]|nr:hypothetical protein OPQ81_002512 [Rhizoctonia solani]